MMRRRGLKKKNGWSMVVGVELEDYISRNYLHLRYAQVDGMLILIFCVSCFFSVVVRRQVILQMLQMTSGC